MSGYDDVGCCFCFQYKTKQTNSLPLSFLLLNASLRSEISSRINSYCCTHHMQWDRTEFHHKIYTWKWKWTYMRKTQWVMPKKCIVVPEKKEHWNCLLCCAVSLISGRGLKHAFWHLVAVIVIWYLWESEVRICSCRFVFVWRRLNMKNEWD